MDLRYFVKIARDYKQCACNPPHSSIQSLKNDLLNTIILIQDITFDTNKKN